jgi:ABC-type transporter MlaC component
MLRRLTLGLFLGPLLVLAPSALADGPAKTEAKVGPATAVVKQANETISGLLKQKVAAGSKEEKDLTGKVTTSLRGFLDIDELGKRAMTNQKLTGKQMTDFLALLRALIEDQYLKGLRANLEYQVEYTGEAPDKDGNLVVTTKIDTKKKGRAYTIEVDYVLVKQGDKLRAWDVKTDGVGLVDNYKTMFDKIIARDGYDGLMKKMQDKKAGTGS